MSTKIAGIAVVIGVFINVLFIVIPSSQQVRYFEGFNQPSNSDFVDGKQSFCSGVNFQVYKSIRKVGQPTHSVVKVNFDDCTAMSKTPLFYKSLSTLNFYLNWIIWTVVCYVLLLIFQKLFNPRSPKSS